MTRGAPTIGSHASGLVSKQGFDDWACLARFDAGSVFARILDEEKIGLSLAKIVLHRELLTFSARAGSLAGLHDSTSRGDHRRAFLGVPIAGRPHDREPRPPSAALHRPAEAPAADRGGGSVVLGRVAARVGEMVRCGRHREAGDGDRLAPRGLRPLLEVALQTGKVAWPGSGRTGGPRSYPEDGARERVGRSADT